MPSHPRVGKHHQQEYVVGVAEDEGQIIVLDETVMVAVRMFSSCVKTTEWLRLGPGVLEHTCHAPGVVVDVTIEDSTEQVELLSEQRQ